MSVNIYPIRTGLVKVKKAQKIRKPGGLIRVLIDKEWTDWLPIYAWVIEHPEGIFIVDTGETARTANDPAYFPKWHPYYRSSVKTKINAEDEIGPQLERLGISPNDIKKVVLTHFHTDHAGGLHHFKGIEILVSKKDFKLASSLSGRLLGYLPHHWPKDFQPFPVLYNNEKFGPFEKSHRLTKAGDIFIIPTPGHTPNHQSVVVKTDNLLFFLAGDTTYSQQILLDDLPDGISPFVKTTLRTMEKIRSLAEEYPMVYLPSHDPYSEERLVQQKVLEVQEKNVESMV